MTVPVSSQSPFKMLVPFVGHDAVDQPFDRHAARRAQAYSRFKSGADTLQIARAFRVREATILKWISIERSRRLGLPDPYEARP